MAYRNTPKLNMPLKKMEKVLALFGESNFFDNKNWGIHLGIDIGAAADTEVFSIGRGVVVYSKLHPGEFSPEGKILQRNWGGIVIIAHKNLKEKKIFYSLYGHLGKRYVKKGDSVEIGKLIGLIGKSMTESNGIWEDEHLHFAIYDGPYHAKVLPGYYNEGEKNTQLSYWKEPLDFIKKYNFRYI
ncbi:MAG TPA: M23 family metallopeptidase [Patescibacteria group bacterium]